MTPFWREGDEAHGNAERDRDAAKQQKARQDIKCPVLSPSDGVTDPLRLASEKERGNGNVHGNQYGKGVRETAAGVRPEVVRGAELNKGPDRRKSQKVLTGAGSGLFSGHGEGQGRKNESREDSNATECKCTGSNQVDEVEK